MPARNTDHHISYTHTVPNTHKHYKTFLTGRARPLHLHSDKPPPQDRPHQEDWSRSFVSPTTCEHSASSCAVFVDLPKKTLVAPSPPFCSLLEGYFQAWGYRFEWGGSCLVRVRGDAVLFGFVGLLSRGPLGRSRRFLGQVSWVVLPLSLESLGQASNLEATEDADDSPPWCGLVLVWAMCLHARINEIYHNS